MSRAKELINPIDLQSMSIKDLELLKLKLFDKALKQFPSSPNQKKVGAELDKVWNEIKRRKEPEKIMTKTNEESQRSKNLLRKSSRIIRLPGDNSRDAEAPKPWSRAESLLKLLKEKLPSGFSVEEFDVDNYNEQFNFVVSFPKSIAKGLEPPDTDVIYVRGGGDIDAYYERPYPGSIAGPPGGGWEIDVSYSGDFYFIDDDGGETVIDQMQSKIIKNILNNYFEDEFLNRIEDELEDYRTAYEGD